MIGGQNTKYALLMFFWTCRNLRPFWEDQMDPKFALGGPKPISRTLHTSVTPFPLCQHNLDQSIKLRFMQTTPLTASVSLRSVIHNPPGIVDSWLQLTQHKCECKSTFIHTKRLAIPVLTSDWKGRMPAIQFSQNLSGWFEGSISDIQSNKISLPPHRQ